MCVCVCVCIFLQSPTTLKDSYIFYPTPHQEARQRLFMLPSCLEGHATPSHENGDRAPPNPPLYPPAPADTRDGAGLARGAVLWVHTHAHKTTRRKKGTKGSRLQAIEAGGVQVGALRCLGCTNRSRSGKIPKVSTCLVSP